jgi:hypothetical protein
MELKWQYVPRNTEYLRHWKAHYGRREVGNVVDRSDSRADASQNALVWRASYFGVGTSYHPTEKQNFPLTDEGLAAAKEWVVVKLVEERMNRVA